MKRTNIMLTADQHKAVKAYAKKQGKTLGRMVRDALDVAYNKKDPLEARRQAAILAYSEGLISLGKLAEVLGLDPVSARLYLKENDLPLDPRDRSARKRKAIFGPNEDSPAPIPAADDALRALEKFASHGGLLPREDIEEILREETLAP